MFTLTNINAMNAAQAVTRSHADVQTSMERLSTGSRINAARDDVAGLAIGVRAQAQIVEMSVALGNAMDAVSILSTAEGALEEVSSLLQRIRELSLQKHNESLAASDQQVIANEVDFLKSEISRIGENTEFNGDSLYRRSSSAFYLGRGQSIAVTDIFDPISYAHLVGDISAAYDIKTGGTDTSHRTEDQGIAGLDGGGYLVKHEHGSYSTSIELFDARGAPTGVTTNIGISSYAPVAALKGGGFVVTTGINSTASVQVYDAAGSLIASGPTGLNQSNLSSYYAITGTSDGGFALAGFDAQSLFPFDKSAVQFRKFDSTASPVTSVIELTADPAPNEGASNVWLEELSNGKFVVTFQRTPETDHAAVILNSDGTVAVPAFSIGNIGNINNSAVALDDGNWMVSDVEGQVKIYDDAGTLIDAPSARHFPATMLFGSPYSTVAERLSNGNVVVATGVTNYVDGEKGVAAVILNPAGDVVKETFAVNSTSFKTTTLDGISLSALSDGGFVIGWPHSDDIYGHIGTDNYRATKRFDADGNFYGNENQDLFAGITAPGSRLPPTVDDIDLALNALSSRRAEIGAKINTLHSTVDNLLVSKTNLSKSRSRNMDANYAEETSKLSARAVVLESATAMLAQANNSQELTMSLIKDWL